MFLKYAYRPVLTTDTRKNQYARAFYQVYSGVLAKDIKSHFLNIWIRFLLWYQK